MKVEKNIMIDNKSNEIEMPLFVNNKYCSTCSIGSLCLLDGPIPDFEVAGIAGLFGVAA